MLEVKEIPKQKSMRTIVTLDSVISNYKFTLIDNSSFVSLNLEIMKFKTNNRLSKKRCYEDKCKFTNFLIENIDKDFYFSPLIFDEIEKVCENTFPYKKIIKNLNRKKIGHDSHKEVLDLLRSIKNVEIKKRRLIDLIKDKGKVIYLNEKEEELYSKFFNSYDYLRSKYGLSNPDFDFLMLGLTLSYERNTTALMSNDFGILSSWKEVLNSRKIKPEQFGFFIREDFPNLQKANYHQRYHS